MKSTKSSAIVTPTIVIGSDHGGYETKQAIIASLSKQGYTLVDVGGFDPAQPDDYPDFAVQVGKAVASDAPTGAAAGKPAPTMGVLICGSGTGMAIAANKVKGIRAAVIYDDYSAKMARMDNDANIACLRGRGFSAKKDLALVHTFLTTPFSGIDRHKRRIKKITSIEATGGRA
jgi:ribose 5-phosphate isomerase B